MDETATFVAALATLDDQLDGLEAALEPLFASSLEETLGRLDTPIDRAKLNVLIAYTMHDLIWIYLRTQGIDPAKHPVTLELERLKEYFGKIQSAEASKSAPRIDKDAASRFIQHAIDSQPKLAEREQREAEQERKTLERKARQRASDLDFGQHSRFAHLVKRANDPPPGRARDDTSSSEDEVGLLVSTTVDGPAVEANNAGAKPGLAKRARPKAADYAGEDLPEDPAARKERKRRRKEAKRLAAEQAEQLKARGYASG